MLCDWCGMNKAVYVKEDVTVISRFNGYNRYTESRYLCHECALRWVFDYSFIYENCAFCGKEDFRERMIKDCNGSSFCSTACMLAHWNFKPIE